jgi:FkbM family methyltransferase
MLISMKIIVFSIICGRNFDKYLRLKFLVFNFAVFARLYDPVELRILNRFVMPGDFVVDGGANFGIYSDRLSKIVGDKGKVLSIEPLDFMCDFMQLNSNRDNIQISKVALSNMNQNLENNIPYIGKGLIEPALATLEKHPNAKAISVKCVKLDDLIPAETNITFLKLDLEGHELKALEGAERILQTARPILQIEDNDIQKNLSDWEQLMSKHSYHLFAIRSRYIKKSSNYYLFPIEKVEKICPLIPKSFIVLKYDFSGTFH